MGNKLQAQGHEWKLWKDKAGAAHAANANNAKAKISKLLVAISSHFNVPS